MRELFIAGRHIADDEDTWVIAELGHSHQGSVQTCKEMIRQAKAAGVDAVKLQKRHNRDLYTPEQYDRPYESENSFGRTYGEHREALEFGWDEYVDLKEYTESLGLVFFATAFDLKSVDFLDKLDVPAIKIASFDIRNLGLIGYAATTGRPLIVSTGSASWADVDGMHDVVRGREHAILHCTSQYPCPAEHLNLGAITAMRSRYPNSTIGFSSHSQGIFAPVIATTMGARIIEVHFTLNRAMKGSDHAWSLEPFSLAKMVKEIRRAKVAMGDGVKRPIEAERAALERAGKVFPSVTA